ncbi:Topoisomerase 1-associated factor 1 [Phytophthora boehmeriae]|uniref:Topoisomerase 1-associated factor 1 n=1 Tax=Phytophthora boehmeriae TaxID=109152 RepID=A0A8T1WJ47_9STRA|nr:Topoisomerase 1-associated factor 1 [Phytophthora boehmeriae]
MADVAVTHQAAVEHEAQDAAGASNAQQDEELEDFAVSSSDEEQGDANEPSLDAAMLNELLLVCSNLGLLRVQNEGEAPVLMRGEDCEMWIHDLQRALRRDHAKHKLVAKQLGKWKILQKKLLPLLVNHQHDWSLVFSILKVLVMLTMKPPRDSTNIAQQLKYLRQYKHEFLRCGVIPIMMTILVDPLSRKGSARTQQDYLNMEIVLTLIRNLLAIPNEDPRFVTSTTSYFSHLQEDFICTLHEENVYEMILLFAQDIDSAENREWNLLIMEMIDLTLDCSTPKSVVAYSKKQLTSDTSKTPAALTTSSNQVRGSSIENYATVKNYHGMTVSVQLLAEMMAYLAELTSSEDPRYQRIADSLQHKIFYERDFLDRLPVLLKTWSPGLFSMAYVVDVITLTHLVFKVLDSQGTIKVLSRRKAYLDKKRQKKKLASGDEEKDDEDSDDGSTDEEETERQAQLLMEMQRKEADFDVRKYFSSMVSSDTIKMYCSVLVHYRENSPKVNHYIHSFFYRTKHFKIYQHEEWTMQPMLFNINVLLLFNKMLQDAYIQRLSEFKSFLDFIRGVVRDFFTLADKNNLLFVETLLRQPYPSKACLLLQRSYDPIDSMGKSKSEAVALGRERHIAAINESRRHRIAMDHEDLEGEAEFQFTLGPSDFQSTSLVPANDKESDQVDDGSASVNADSSALSSKPKPKKKAATSRAATERAKNWSKVEDRYLAKMFMKYRHLPSVYEVISYEDMFQDRDRTPEQIERRVKYLKLHRKTHDSSDEEEEKSNSEDEEMEADGAAIGDESDVRQSRLERDLATLDTARPRRRLRRGADLSDDDSDDSDDDMLLREQARSMTDTSPSFTKTVTPASENLTDESDGARLSLNEKIYDSTAGAQGDGTKESQTQAIEDTQVSEQSSGQTEFAIEDHSAEGKGTDAEITDIGKAVSIEEPTTADIVIAEMEATTLNDTHAESVVAGAASGVQSLKRARDSDDAAADEQMPESSPAKKIQRAEVEAANQQ